MMIPSRRLPLQEISELIVDAYGCGCDLNDLTLIEKAARQSVALVGAEIVEVSHHRFQPHGLTLVLILKESHFVFSSWPEHSFAVVNLFLCNPSMDAHKVWRDFSKTLKPRHEALQTVTHRIGPWKQKRTGS